MLRSFLNTTTALAVAIAPIGAPLATTATLGGAVLVSTGVSAFAQDVESAKQRLDAARRAFQHARKTGEGVEEAKQELDAARAAMAEAIGSKGQERAKSDRKPNRDMRREASEPQPEPRAEQPEAAEKQSEPEAPKQENAKSASQPDDVATPKERPQPPADDAAQTTPDKPKRNKAEGKSGPEVAVPKERPQPPAEKAATPSAEEPASETAEKPAPEEDVRPRKKADKRDRGETDKVAEEPAEARPEREAAKPRPKSDAPEARPLAEAPVEMQIEEAEEKPVAVVPDNITDEQRKRLREAEHKRRVDARRDRENLIGAAAAGIAVGALIPALGGKVIEDEGDRIIVERDGRYYVRKDESAYFRHDSRDVEVEHLRNGNTRETITRRNGSQIITVRDPGGYILRRVKVTPHGERFVLYDARDENHERANDYDHRLPPIHVTIPRDQYIIESGRYGRRDLARFWMAPPVEPVTYNYSLRDVRENERIRAMVRRVDLDTVTFDTGSATVRASQVPYLADIAGGMLDVIDANPRALFLVEGHTDAVGSDIYNLFLSDRRAETVAQILVDAYDVPPENLVVQGYGEQYLKIDTPYADWRNRRVTIRNITPLLNGASG